MDVTANTKKKSLIIQQKDKIVNNIDTILTPEIKKIILKIDNIKMKLKKVFVERDDIIDIAFEAIISKKNVFLLGPPGCGKSLVLRRINQCIKGSKYFFQQLMPQTTPELLFGPISMSKLKEDKLERITEGYLPDCNIGDIDEVFHCNAGILQGMNEILNEHSYNGKPVDIDTVFGAANFISEENELIAFIDRWTYKLEALDIEDDMNFIHMIDTEQYFELNDDEYLTREEIKKLQSLVVKVRTSDKQVVKSKIIIDENGASKEIKEKVNISNIGLLLSNLRKSLAAEYIRASPRKWKWCVNAMKAHALLEMRDVVSASDLTPLTFMLWDEPEQIAKIRSIIGKIIDPVIDEVKTILIQAQSVYDSTSPLSYDVKNDRETILQNLDKLRKLNKQIESLQVREGIEPDTYAAIEVLSQKLIMMINSLISQKLH
jgi:MoxR-like ATPase